MHHHVESHAPEGERRSAREYAQQQRTRVRVGRAARHGAWDEAQRSSTQRRLPVQRAELTQPRRVVEADGERRAKARSISRRHAASQHLAAGRARLIGGRNDGHAKVAGAVAQAATEAGADEADLEAAVDGGSEGRDGTRLGRGVGCERLEIKELLAFEGEAEGDGARRRERRRDARGEVDGGGGDGLACKCSPRRRPLPN